MYWNWLPLVSFAITGTYLAVALPYEVRCFIPIAARIPFLSGSVCYGTCAFTHATFVLFLLSLAILP